MADPECCTYALCRCVCYMLQLPAQWYYQLHSIIMVGMYGCQPMDVESYEVNRGKKPPLLMCSPCITLLSFRQRGDHVRQQNMIYDMIHFRYVLRASNVSTATWQAITIFADSRPASMKRPDYRGVSMVKVATPFTRQEISELLLRNFTSG